MLKVIRVLLYKIYKLISLSLLYLYVSLQQSFCNHITMWRRGVLLMLRISYQAGIIDKDGGAMH